MESRGSEERTSTSPRNRLDSWKEIAAYLRRSVRTLQRWERDEGMPVHRHQHEAGGSVYAYSDELNEWWEQKDEVNGGVTPAAAPWRSGRWTLASVGVVALVLLVIFVPRSSQTAADQEVSDSPNSAMSDDRPWMLIADVESRDGSHLSIETFDSALRGKISQAGSFRIVPDDRIAETLQLMRRPVTDRLDEPTAREVAVRLNEVAFVLVPRVERVASSSRVSVALKAAETGEVVHGSNEEVAGEADIASAVGSLVASLHEAPPPGVSDPKARPALTRVTTASSQALRLFTAAERQMTGLGPMGTEPLYRRTAHELLLEATKEDPDFATAHIFLAWTYNDREQRSEYMQSAERAVELAAGVSHAERLFIEGSYSYLKGWADLPGVEFPPDWATAVEKYETLALVQPDHFWARNNASSLYVNLGQSVVAARHRLANAELNPHIGWSLRSAAGVHAEFTGNFEEAERLHRRANELLGRTPGPVRASLTFLPVRQLAASGDVAGAYAAFQEVLRELSASNQSDEMRSWIAGAHAAFGELDASEEVTRSFESPSLRCDGLARVSFWRTNDFSPQPVPMPAIEAIETAGIVHLARTGRLEEAKEALEGLKARTRAHQAPVSQWQGLASEILLAEGDSRQAKDLLEQSVPDAFAFLAPTFLRAEALARLRVAGGDPQGAVRTLEKVTKVDTHRVLDVGFWYRSQASLLQLYRELGRKQEEEALEEELRKRLRFADADHPIVQLLDEA